MEFFLSPSIKTLIDLALQEDIPNGDITTMFTTEKDRRVSGFVIAKEELVFCGFPLVKAIFEKITSKKIIITDKNNFDYKENNFETKIFDIAEEGELLQKGKIAFRFDGYAREILMAERTILNFLQRLSGIATMTKKYVKELEGTKIKIVDTRKTAPGFRPLDKYAVRVGGGFNHRMGLSDGILIKENHIIAAGSITKAVESVRKNAPHTSKIEVETTTIKEVQEALNSKADIIMLDNMSIEMMREAIALIDKKALIEVSGNVTIERLSSLRELDIDFISTGALTHSVKAADLSMKFQ
ncbi:carboxylating nicotinate-nucleotide diphosphorylase [bacterium]|nr:carboxylating nicotinate-nucleotide diphosphorylase [bacterium]